MRTRYVCTQIRPAGRIISSSTSLQPAMIIYFYGDNLILCYVFFLRTLLTFLSLQRLLLEELVAYLALLSAAAYYQTRPVSLLPKYRISEIRSKSFSSNLVHFTDDIFFRLLLIFGPVCSMRYFLLQCVDKVIVNLLPGHNTSIILIN